jgi:hypothetical protein
VPGLEVDEALSEELTASIVRWQEQRPRNRQTAIGPSGIGGCREFLRATMNEEEGIPERPRAIDAAFVGTVVGDAIEAIWGADPAFPGITTQPRIVTKLPLGLTIAGNGDAVQSPSPAVPKGRLLDLKSKDKLAEILREGPSLENMIQVSVYLLGAFQQGLVEEGAYAALVYFDRSGADKKFVAGRLEWDAAMRFIDLLKARIEEVAGVIAAGSPDESRWNLRDKPPSWCFATQCPFRMACWGGSASVPTGSITHPLELDAVSRYLIARQEEKDAAARKAAAREELKPIVGITAGPVAGASRPVIVSWSGNRISVTEE